MRREPGSWATKTRISRPLNLQRAVERRFGVSERSLRGERLDRRSFLTPPSPLPLKLWAVPKLLLERTPLLSGGTFLGLFDKSSQKI